MRIDHEDLRRHYASLPDGALMALNRAELSEFAKPLFDEELARRKLNPEQEAVPLDQPDEMYDAEDEFVSADEPEPDWVEEATCAYSFEVRNRDSDAATDACVALKAAGIPCHVITEEQPPPKPEVMPRYLIQLMVPAQLAMHAMSVLDRDVFNEGWETEWRSSLEVLSDNDLRALNPDVLCAGLIDRAARLRRAYEEEMVHRKLAPRR